MIVVRNSGGLADDISTAWMLRHVMRIRSRPLQSRRVEVLSMIEEVIEDGNLMFYDLHRDDPPFVRELFRWSGPASVPAIFFSWECRLLTHGSAQPEGQGADAAV